MESPVTASKTALPTIPRTVWALGFVSLCMDVSSELVHSLLPVFLATTLGASVLSIGIIEGIAEATAMIVKVFSGALSDYIGKRKGLLLLGYGMAALTKPLFPLAHSIETVLTARFLDRIGKGIRGLHVMRWWQMWLQQKSVVPALGCANQWIRWVPLWGRAWPLP
jgi:MFS family permease